MRCHNARKGISLLVDGRIGADERDAVFGHLQCCAGCAEYLQSLQNLRAMLRRIEATPVPWRLSRKLRLIALSQAARQVPQPSWVRTPRRRSLRTWFGLENFIRPAALTFAGGLLSAVAISGLLFPTFGGARQRGFDPLIEVVTLPDGSVQGAPGETPGVILRGPALSCDEIIVELTVDQDGFVRDWNMVRGQMTQDVKDLIVYSKFIPATYFGRPVTSKVQVALHAADRRSLS
jgi:hypothetical protein